MHRAIRWTIAIGASALTVQAQDATDQPLATTGAAAYRVIERDVYADRIRAFWLGQSIANWTGIRAEGARREPPFLTDQDWGTVVGLFPLRFVFINPWNADDDTDIEYIYSLLTEQHGPLLTPDQINAGWERHINRFIWVSNERARDLMDLGVTAPATSLPVANALWLRIDAQLTTEYFGLLAPGMPALALELSELPIRTTAGSHAAHASQFFVLLHALAPVIPETVASEERGLWLIDAARRWIPDRSKAAGIVDLVRADFLANPDVEDWERTRDLIADRYQVNDDAYGFEYRGWTESSVNFASAVIALLYGQGDYPRTVQIATLCGWDADNPAATMGGLLGLMHGTQAIRDAFPGQNMSDRYRSSRTRDMVPDLLPADPDAEDTFTMMAQRALAVIDQSVTLGGGRLSPGGDAWLVPGFPTPDPLIDNPIEREARASANNRVPQEGGIVTATSSIGGNAARIANGVQTDQSGLEVLMSADTRAYSTQGATQPPGSTISLSVSYDRTVPVRAVRFIEGDHAVSGGFFSQAYIEVQTSVGWVPAPAAQSTPFNAGVPYQIIDFVLDEPVEATGIRIVGTLGGSIGYVTCAELDALAPEAQRARAGFDINADRRIDAEDLHAWFDQPRDIDDDGDADGADYDALERVVRWRESIDTMTVR